jgi:3D (Asp-Asp-Asp) domain-containing protein
MAYHSMFLIVARLASLLISNPAILCRWSSTTNDAIRLVQIESYDIVDVTTILIPINTFILVPNYGFKETQTLSSSRA